MLDVVQTPGKEYYKPRQFCIGVHPRHLWSAVSERCTVCSPEVRTELYNQTNLRHGLRAKNLSQDPRCPNWDSNVVEYTHIERDAVRINFMGPHEGKLIQKMISAPLIY